MVQYSIVMCRQVYQGERVVANRNKSIGGFTLNGLPRGPPGRKVDFELSIDEDGVLSARAKLQCQKEWKSCTLRVESLSTADIISNVEDAERFRYEDQLELERLSALHDLIEFVTNNETNIPAEVSQLHVPWSFVENNIFSCMYSSFNVSWPMILFSSENRVFRPSTLLQLNSQKCNYYFPALSSSTCQSSNK